MLLYDDLKVSFHLSTTKDGNYVDKKPKEVEPVDGDLGSLELRQTYH